MARQRRDRRGRGGRRAPRKEGLSISFSLPYDKRNWVVMAIGLGLIVLGYWFLSQPPVDGPMSLTIAPILLVLGYCVVVPVALLLGPGTSLGKPRDRLQARNGTEGTEGAGTAVGERES